MMGTIRYFLHDHLRHLPNYMWQFGGVYGEFMSHIFVIKINKSPGN